MGVLMSFQDSRMMRTAWALCAAALFGWLLVAASPASAQRMTDEEFQAAMTKLDDPLPDQRIQAIDSIGQRGWRFRREAGPKLRQILTGDPEWRVRASAGRAIGRLSLRDAVPDLVRALRDAQVEVRVVAAAALWRLPDPAAVPALIELLADPDPAARQWGALALGVTRDTRATQPLIQLLGDGTDAVRLDAIRSLGRIGDPNALEPLVRYANNESATLEARLEAINSIASLQGPAKVNALVRMLDNRNLDIRLQTVRALGQVGDALVVPRLRQLNQNPGNNEIAQAIQEALQAIDQRAREASQSSTAPTPAPAPAH